MSVSVNQRNRAVSQAALDAVASARRFTYTPLFALPGGHNIVDGTFRPFAVNSDSGWWGSVISDSTGQLSTPGEFTYTGRMSAISFQLTGINGNYPVDFTLTLHYGAAVLKTVEVTGNTQEALTIALEEAYDIDSYKLIITRISVANDVLKVATASFSSTIAGMMKEPGRRIHGRVEVTYANALTDAAITVNDGANGASGRYLSNGDTTISTKHFKLFDNKLDGTYKLIDSRTGAGWWPKALPDSTGTYQTPQTLSMQFSTRTLYGLSIYWGDSDESYPVDFTIELVTRSRTTETITVTGNTSSVYRNAGTFRDVDEIRVTVTTVSRPGRPAVFTEIPIVSSIVYEDGSLVDMSLLEELTYVDSLEKLGGVSANELTVNFSNEDKSFYFNNPDSPVAKYLKKNRRIRAWLGVEIPDSADIIWSVLGTFWSYSWDIPMGSLLAKVTAFDTIGLLGTKTYFEHYVYHDKSLGWLIENLLNSAKTQINFLEWIIDEELYNVIIPVAWFKYDSYTAALNRLASCDIVNIFCDRDGRVVARKRLSDIQAPDDVWSDSTNVIDKSYPTLYTAVPNYIDVGVSRVSVVTQEVLNVDDANITVTAGAVQLFNFSSPVESLVSVNIATDAEYTYEWYSWGLRVAFTTAGTVTGVTAQASALAVDVPTSVHLQDDAAVSEDGVISCNITSDLIQTYEHAQGIAQYLYNKLSGGIYDVDVTYRGDIALTLNNKILLPDGIAPDNLYHIKRHELYWNGALSGSAELST